MFDWLRSKFEELILDRDFKRAQEKLKKDPLLGLNLDSVKNTYSNKFYELREIINSEDPMSLIDMGAANDEYEAEVKTIIVQLDSKTNEDEVLNLIYDEFEKWFGDAGSKENYKALARKILEWKINK
jgi:hypothetical protein